MSPVRVPGRRTKATPKRPRCGETESGAGLLPARSSAKNKSGPSGEASPPAHALLMANYTGIARKLGGRGRGLAGSVRASGGRWQDPAEGLSDTRTDTEQMSIFNWSKTAAEEPGRRAASTRGQDERVLLFVCDLPCGCLTFAHRLLTPLEGENHPGILEHGFFPWSLPSAVALARPGWSAQPGAGGPGPLRTANSHHSVPRAQSSQVLRRGELAGKGGRPAVPSPLRPHEPRAQGVRPCGSFSLGLLW